MRIRKGHFGLVYLGKIVILLRSHLMAEAKIVIISQKTTSGMRSFKSYQCCLDF